MCRKTYLRGCCLACLGLGILIGYCMERWFVCFCTGLGLVVLGLSVLHKR